VKSKGSLKAKFGSDEQKPDMRPAMWGNLAMDRDAQYLIGNKAGASGRAQMKDVCLTLGDL